MPEIHLERQDYELGEVVSGNLLFVSDDPRLERCQQVKVECHARIHGSGTAEYVHAAPPLVRDGKVVAPLRIPFEFRLPVNAPPTFEGRYVKVTWRIHLSLDIPWAVDPTFTAVFTVRPRPARS